ncbi:uncharacterized protein [Malus domestica]|uniref:uncharacterized protein n=1 Tax=Malus domestica TaxID=3750 RepID=UPI0039770077
MNDNDSLYVYIAKLFDLINQMRSYGEDLSNQRIIQKLLISLPKSYDSIAAVIENTKDLDTIDAQDVVVILKGYEQRLDRHGESSMEKAFASLNITTKPNRFNGQPNSSKYQKNFKSRGKQWGNKADWGNKASFSVKNDANNTGDSGCSNHMTSRENLLVDIDKNVKAKVQVSTRVLIEVAVNGTLIIETMKGRRYIREIMLVPGLAEKLLSVGQMTEHSYFLLFGDYRVDVFDDMSLRTLVVSVKQKGNRCFPLIFSTNKELALRTNMQEDAKMWHKRFGHLNFRNFKLLQSQGMALGLPKIQDSDDGEAINTAVYLLNRCLTSALDSVTPFKAYSGRRPGIKHLKVFGVVCYSLILGDLRHKLEASSVKGIFIGYGACKKGYRILNPTTMKVIVSRDVVFDENGKWNWEENKVREICIPLIPPEFRETDVSEVGESSRISFPISCERSSA